MSKIASGLMASIDGDDVEFRVFSEKDDDTMTLKNSITNQSLNKESFLSAQYSIDIDHERRDSHEVLDASKRSIIATQGNTDEGIGPVKAPSELDA